MRIGLGLAVILALMVRKQHKIIVKLKKTRNKYFSDKYLPMNNSCIMAMISQNHVTICF